MGRAGKRVVGRAGMPRSGRSDEEGSAEATHGGRCATAVCGRGHCAAGERESGVSEVPKPWDPTPQEWDGTGELVNRGIEP